MKEKENQEKKKGINKKSKQKTVHPNSNLQPSRNFLKLPEYLTNSMKI